MHNIIVLSLRSLSLMCLISIKFISTKFDTLYIFLFNIVNISQVYYPSMLTTEGATVIFFACYTTNINNINIFFFFIFCGYIYAKISLNEVIQIRDFDAKNQQHRKTKMLCLSKMEHLS